MPQGQKQIIVVKCNTLNCTVSTRPDESQVFYGPVLGEDSGACGQSEQRKQYLWSAHEGLMGKNKHNTSSLETLLLRAKNPYSLATTSPVAMWTHCLQLLQFLQSTLEIQALSSCP